MCGAATLVATSMRSKFWAGLRFESKRTIVAESAWVDLGDPEVAGCRRQGLNRRAASPDLAHGRV